MGKEVSITIFYYLALIFFSTKKELLQIPGKVSTIHSVMNTTGVSTESTRRPAWGERGCEVGSESG